MRDHEDERGRLAHFNELTAGEGTMRLDLQPSVCVCVCVCACESVFDLYIHDGPLPVCMSLPCLSDSTGDQQLDEGGTEHTLLTSGIQLLCVHMFVCVSVCVNVCLCCLLPMQINMSQHFNWSIRGKAVA